ncbi:MAG: putative transcriptional regulator, GntR family [Gammaproteobacteria bacterium]|nr:putative transcriptional regulator, GntR family [Gammaproteobacteria bacterium]
MEHFNNGPLLADWVKTLKPSAMQKSIAFANDPDFISFALGLPDCKLLHIDAISNASAELLTEGSSITQYAKPLIKLKQQIVSLMKMRGITCRESDIFLTSGAQQGISLLARMLVNEKKDSIAVEDFTYPGFLQTIQPLQSKLLTIQTDFHSGISIEDTEKVLAKRPALLYVVPDGGNPHTVTISREKRQQLAELARTYRVPIIEDDPYSYLNYTSNMLPPIKSFEQNWVFYVGTLSKILAPSLRVGWIIAPEPFHQALSFLKEGSDLDIATYSHRIASKILGGISIESHIANLIQTYRLKRDTMLQEIQKHFPKNCELKQPASGLFIWAKLPENFDTNEILKIAISEFKVAFIPGAAFYAGNSTNAPSNFIRLNFTYSDIDVIKEGIERIGKAIAIYQSCQQEKLSA